MNEKQNGLYWREWQKARRVLRKTMSPTEADTERHEMHARALGEDKSSTLLTNSEFDAVLKEFRAISRASDFKGQQKLADMAAERKRWTIRHLLTALELPEEEAELLISRRQRGGVLVTASQTAMVTFETIGAADLERIMIDLKKRCRARWPRKGDLLTEIRVVGMTLDLDNEAIRTAICGAGSLFRIEDLTYEELLNGLSTLRQPAPAPAEAESGDPDWTV